MAIQNRKCSAEITSEITMKATSTPRMIRISRPIQTRYISIAGNANPAPAGRGGTNYAVVAATPAVSYLLVTRADGSTARVATTRAGSARFAAFTSPPGNKVTHWAAYSAAGRRLASGRLP